MQYDVLLSGGRVIDPAQGIDGTLDVAIQDGRVAAVQAAIPKDSAKEVFDVSGKLVLPGLIDTHAHVYQYVTGRFGLNADMVGVHSGVTALIDQGGPSCMTLPGFREFIREIAKSSRRANCFFAVEEGSYSSEFFGRDEEPQRPSCSIQRVTYEGIF